jgi:rSAM/selenodomain-associated transferase 1
MTRSRRSASAEIAGGGEPIEPVVVAIMAKEPRAGEAKTRLCPPLSHAEAAELYRRFLLDKIEQVRALDAARPAIAYTPADASAFFAEVAPDFTLVPQRGADLGDRLANSLGELLRRGHRGALAIDSDTPTLPLEFLRQAIDLVTRPEIDVVLGPTEDGGYYLIGLRAVHRQLFEAMAWSTSGVLAETVRRAEACGLRVACLPSWYDVDTPDDLARLRSALAAAPDGAPRHTRGILLAHPTRRLSEVPWKTTSTRPIYQNRWLSLREDLVEMPNGRTTIYGVVSCGECVGVLPFLDPDTVLLVRQYRYVAGRPTWEMPTGGVHAGESVEAAAQRELAEEIGYRAGRLTRVSTYHTSKSVVDETAHLFLGEEMVQLALPPDETEFIEVRPFAFREVLERVLSGEIVDSMTIIAVLHAARTRGG